MKRRPLGARGRTLFLPKNAKSPLQFTADITAVSDDGLRRRKSGETPLSGAYSPQTEIQAARINPLHDQGRGDRAALSEPQDAPQASAGRRNGRDAGKACRSGIQTHQQEKLPTISVSINEPDVQIGIKYDANQRYGSGSHPSYTAAYSLRRNPVYRSLESKLDQLKNSGPAGAVGILLCDGGCALLEECATSRRGGKRRSGHQGIFSAELLDYLCHHADLSTQHVRHLRWRGESPKD